MSDQIQPDVIICNSKRMIRLKAAASHGDIVRLVNDEIGLNTVMKKSDPEKITPGLKSSLISSGNSSEL